MAKINNPRYPDSLYILKEVNIGTEYDPIIEYKGFYKSACRLELNKTFTNQGSIIAEFKITMDREPEGTKLASAIGTGGLYVTSMDDKIEGDMVKLEHSNFQTFIYFNGTFTQEFSHEWPTSVAPVAPVQPETITPPVGYDTALFYQAYGVDVSTVLSPIPSITGVLGASYRFSVNAYNNQADGYVDLTLADEYFSNDVNTLTFLNQPTEITQTVDFVTNADGLQSVVLSATTGTLHLRWIMIEAL